LQQKNLRQDTLPTESQKQTPQRALVFVPHADDIAYSMGGLMTELKNKYGDKLAFDFVIATDGTAGFSPDDQKKYSSTERKKIRQYEQIREAVTLEADSIAFLHYADSHLENHTKNAETDLVREIQLTRPTYVFSYAPRYEQKNPNKNILSTNLEHVDHIASGKILENTIKKSGMRASVPNQKNPLRQPHRPKFWFQFGYDQSVSPETNYAYQLTNKTFVQKLSAFATNKSQTMINWELSAEINALHYLIRVNREVDGNNSSLSENFVVQTIPRMS
jgi:LmbE family N-acetylglucosaminyl deacetylase